MDILYKRIKAKREELGMTQEELAERIGYKSRSSINKIELGLNDLPQSKVIEFAKVFNVTPAYLMGFTDDEQDDLSSYVPDFGYGMSKSPYGDHKKNLEYFQDKPEILETYKEIYENETLQLLFDSARDLEPEDLEAVLKHINLIKAARRNE